MTTKRGLLCIAAVIPWLVALPAAAQRTTGEIEAGLGYVSDESVKFGEYNGLDEKGPFAIGHIFLRGRMPWDSPKSDYWEVIGTNLGLTSRYARLAYGWQGTWGAWFEYDQIPQNELDDVFTPYSGVGSRNLTLPPELIESGNTTDVLPLDGNLRPLKISTERKRLGGGLRYHPGERWTVSADYRHEFKDGTDTLNAPFASNGGNPRSVTLPMPIDFETDILDAMVEYAGDRLQAQVGYSGSWFTNNKDRLTFDNPYSNGLVGNIWPDPPNGTAAGRLAIPPSNQAHRVTLTTGYNVGERTRLTGVFSYARMTQDENFLPYTVNPDSAVPVPLPRSSFDGKIDHILVDVQARSNPWRNWNFGARYRYDDRDNDSPRDLYLMVQQDVTNQATVDDGAARRNRLYGYTQQRAGLDGTWRFHETSSWQLGYDFEHWDRDDYEEVEATREHTVWTRLQSTPVDWTSGWLHYAFSTRDRDTYRFNQPFLLGHTPEFIEAESPPEVGGRGFEIAPDLRKFYMADRTGHAVSGSLSFFPHEQVVLSTIGSFTNYDYEDRAFGRTRFWLADGTLDVSYRPLEEFSVSVFYTYEQQGIAQEGIQFAGFGGQPAEAFYGNDDRSWDVDTNDVVHNGGIRLEWDAIPDILETDLEYRLSFSQIDYDIDGGSLTGTPVGSVGQLPDIESRLHRVILGADYHFTENISARGFYWFEKLNNQDYAVNDVEVDTIETVLGLGPVDWDYSVHVFGLSVSYRF